jgi:hypothetical protein
MFSFVKKMFGGCECSTNDNNEKERAALEKRLQAAHEQDRIVRDAVTEKQIDKGLKDTMEASDPVAKY